MPRRYVDKLDTYAFNTRYVYMNGWSFLHFLSGVFLALLFDMTLAQYVAIHTIWEAWQVYIGMTPLTLRGGIDVCVDTVLGAAGFCLVKSTFISSLIE